MEKELDELQFDDDVVSYVNAEYKRRQSERIPFELQWRLNTEFIKGNQFVTINPQMRTLEEVPKLFWYQEREVFNQLATIVETRIARLTRQKPIMKTRPFSNEDSDIQASKISSMLLGMKWYDTKMDSKYEDLVTWLEHAGTVIIKGTWNADSGRLIGQDVKPQVDEATGMVMDEEVTDVFEGDLESDVLSPYEFYPDSTSRNSLEDSFSVIHAKAFKLSEIKEMWGKGVDEEPIDAFTLQAGNGFGGIGYNSGNFRGKSEKLKGHAVVKEYYERPSLKYPEGRLIVVAGDTLLYKGDLPYAIGDNERRDFPFVVIKCIPIPNQFFGASVAERCIPIQRRYNALRNRKAEYLNRVAMGQWYEANGSLDGDTELNNSPGNIIRYNPGMPKPEPVQYPSLPSSFETEEQTLLAEFTAVSGVSELSRFSEAPSGVKSGVALSIAGEQDDTRIGMTASRIANGIKELGRIWLRLLKQFVSEPRILRHVGNDVDIYSWTASDLKSDDIIIENASALAETPAQRRQMVFDLIGTGIFNRPETNPFEPSSIYKILELIEIGHWENGLDYEEKIQENRAKRENRLIQQGQMPSIMDYDDHNKHIMEHNRFRMTPEYDELMKSPEGMFIEQMMAQHVAMHRQAVQQAQFQEMLMQQQMALEAQMMAQQGQIAMNHGQALLQPPIQ